MEQDETGTAPLDVAAMTDAQVGMVLQLVLLRQWNDLSDNSRAVIAEAMGRLQRDAHAAWLFGARRLYPQLADERAENDEAPPG